MKRLSIILGSALVMLTVSCAKDATNDLTANGPATVLEMNIENGDDARTSLGTDGYAVLWSKGDRVAINGVQTTIADEFDGAQSATFKVSGVVAPYKVLYPADVLNEDNTITVSEIQNYAPDSFAQGAAVMVGYSESATVQVKNLYGLVKLTVAKSGDELIKSVTLHSNNLEAMTGTFAVDYTEAAIEPLAGMDFVKVVAADGIAYNDEGKAVIYIALPADTYAQGFTIKVATDKGTMSKKMSKSLTLERSKIYTLPELAFKANTDEAIEITDAATLQAFLTAVNDGDYKAYIAGNGEVQLGADIDMTGVTITPATTFDGVFNGRGYKLKNWTADGTALFTKTTANAVVKNIIIAESCSMDVSNANPGYKAFIVSNNLGIVSGCSNYADMVFAPTQDLNAQYMIGAIAGISTSETATVTNCYNEGNLTVTIQSTTASSYYFGGIVGDTANGKSGHECLSKSINKGDIIVNIDGKNGWNNIYIGGLSGACNNAGVLADCTNKGKVDFYIDKAYKGAYVNIGGVTGYTANTINNCKNYGDVSIRTNTYKAADAPQITRPAIAGIAGYANGDVSNCGNYGHILLQGTKDVRFAGTTSTAAGTGNIGHPVIGGICGSVGYPKEIASSAKTHTISDCHNYGTVEVINPAGLTWMSIGGVVGFPTGTVKNCVNEKSGVVKVTMGGSQTYLGGVYGATYESSNVIDGCANYGKVWFLDSKAVELGKGTTRSYAGGISGGYNKGSNNAATNCVNEGEIIAEAKMVMIAGGLFGCHHGSITDCVNRGTVTMKNATAQTDYLSEIGGVVGYINGMLTNCSNYGAINNYSDAGTDTGAIVATLGAANAIVGGVVDCTINAPESNAGLVIGSTRSNAIAITLGSSEAPITIKKTTAINGVAVTDADITETGKLAGILRNKASIVVTNVVLE